MEVPAEPLAALWSCERTQWRLAMPKGSRSPAGQ